MLAYERNDISDRIDFNKSDESKECTLCHYWYFLHKSFSYLPYLCDGCYNMTQKCNKLKNIAIIRIKKTVYRICFLFMSKRKAKKSMANSNVIDKKCFSYFFFHYIKMDNTIYYQRNREIMLNRAKHYYENDKERLREQARNKYRNLSEENKEKKERVWKK